MIISAIAMASRALLVYGATGYIGRLAAHALLEAGIRPLLGGRDPAAVSRLAAMLGLESRCAVLSDAAALDRALDGVAVLLNAAGPFASTFGPLLDACLRSRVHYLDLTGEVLVFDAIRARGAEACRRGVVLLPGIGFDVVPSDCLAAFVASRLSRPCILRIAVSGLELASRGSARTLVDAIGKPLLVRRLGVLRPLQAGSLERTFDYGAGPSPSLGVNWGDLVTAFHTTGVQNIETYFEATPTVRAMVAAGRLIGAMPMAAAAQQMLNAAAATLPEGPDAEERRTRSAVIVAEAEDAAGRIERARLRTPEAYTLSARTAAAVASEVLAGNFETGFQTPARLYGADYILRFGGVVREAMAA